MRIVLLAMVLAAGLPLHAETQRYALVLKDPPVAERFHSPEEIQGEAAQRYRKQIEAAQTEVRAELDRLQIRVTGATQVLTNCLFVIAPRAREAELRGLEGVKSIVRLSRKYKTE